MVERTSPASRRVRRLACFCAAWVWSAACTDDTSGVFVDANVVDSADAAAESCGHWQAGPTLLAQRESTPAFRLPDGRVLLVGGHFDNRTGMPINSSEIVDVDAGKVTLTAEFSVPRTNSGPGPTVQLSDGRVLSGSPWVDPKDAPIPAEIWSARAGTWVTTGAQHTGTGVAVALPDGRVLVAGGIDWGVDGAADAPLARAELWDEATGRFQLVGSMSTARTGHGLAVLDGEVIAFGGFATYPGGTGIGVTEAFDAKSGTWRPVAEMLQPRAAPCAKLDDSRLLVAGGTEESGGYKEEIGAAEIYDHRTHAWSVAAPLHVPRAAHTLTRLADGRVIAVGGATNSFLGSTDSVEIFDPEANTWTEVEPLLEARGLHAAVLLEDGRLLVAGGYPRGARTTEIYTPCPRR